jgi:glycerophosphoryl diester phosphodiesterase
MAHRGNQVACPENTLAAFRRAFEEGADILETDLHMTADGVFVCIHDATLDRTTDGGGAVAEQTLAEIKRYSASFGRPEFAAERVPTLDELLEILPENVALALELKSDAFLDQAVCGRLVDSLGRKVRERTIALSFSMERLQALKRVAPDMGVGWITLRGTWPVRGVEMLGPHPKILLRNPLYVLLAHRRGQLVAPLDPLPQPRLGYYRLLGVDAVLADDPGAVRRALGRG